MKIRKKIKFESATIVKPPQVVVDNVAHDLLPAEVEGGTPVTPDVLNKIQSNIEEVFNGEESMGSIRVDDIECKQLFDKNNPNKIIGYINGGTGAIASNSSASTIYIKCLPSTTYTVSKIAGKRFAVATFNDVPAIGSVSTNLVSENTASSLTITSGESDNYLAVFYHLSGTDTLTEQEILDSIQIEKGPVATKKVDFKKYGYNSQESMGEIVVDDISCKNILNSNNPKYTNGTVLWTGSDSKHYYSCASQWGQLSWDFEVKAGETYAFSCKSVPTGLGIYFSKWVDGVFVSNYIENGKENKYRLSIDQDSVLRVMISNYEIVSDVLIEELMLKKGLHDEKYILYKNFDNADVYKSINGAESTSINDLSTYADIINAVFNNSKQGILSKASIGSKTTSNVQTLLGNPNLGNWGIAIFKSLYLEDSTALIEVLAWAYYGGGVARGYLTRDNTGVFWTGWKNIATSGTMVTDTQSASTMSLRPDTTEDETISSDEEVI